MMAPRDLFALSDLVDADRVKPARVSSGFGSSRGGPNTKRPGHNGVDLRVRRGSPLYCPAKGAQFEKLLRTPGDKEGTGNGIAVIFHVPIPNTGGKLARIGIAHMSSAAPRLWHMGAHRRPRSVLMVGELLGWSGNTGGSTGPHVHLTVTVDGAKVDPAEWIDLDG